MSLEGSVDSFPFSPFSWTSQTAKQTFSPSWRSCWERSLTDCAHLALSTSVCCHRAAGSAHFSLNQVLAHLVQNNRISLLHMWRLLTDDCRIRKEKEKFLWFIHRATILYAQVYLVSCFLLLPFIETTAQTELAVHTHTHNSWNCINCLLIFRAAGW